MKLFKSEVAAREEFVRQAVRAEPKITGDKLQALLKKYFGHQMRLGRLYAVKREAIESLTPASIAPKHVDCDGACCRPWTT